MKIRTTCAVCKSKNLKTKYVFENYSIVECAKCSSLFRDRIISQKESEALYDKNYYLDLQKEYFINCLTPNPKDASRINDFNQRIDLLSTLLNKKKIKLLDVGAGTGAFAYLAQKKGWETESIEISSFAARIARSKFKVKMYRGEVTDKKFTGKNFDVVTLWESIANIEDTPRLLSTLRKITKRNGQIALLTTVVDSWLYDIARIIYNLSFKKIKYFIKEGYPIHHSNHFTRSKLQKLLKNSGFKVIYTSNQEIPYKYTKLPKIVLPVLLTFGKIAQLSGRTIQVLIVAKRV